MCILTTIDTILIDTILFNVLLLASPNCTFQVRFEAVSFSSSNATLLSITNELCLYRRKMQYATLGAVNVDINDIRYDVCLQISCLDIVAKYLTMIDTMWLNMTLLAGLRCQN